MESLTETSSERRRTAMFEFHLHKPLSRNSGIADAGPLDFEYRLFLADISLEYSGLRYGQRWKAIPLLGFSGAIYATAKRLTLEKRASFELPEGNDELFFVRTEYSVEFHTAVEAQKVKIPFNEFQDAAVCFCRSALNQILERFPDLRKNRSVVHWYPDWSSLTR